MKGKKRRTRKKPGRPSLALIEKKTRTGRIITFPGIAGRTVEKIRLFTDTDDHAISINFADQTLLSLHFDPRFFVHGGLYDNKTGDLRTIQEWPRILSEPKDPG